ncbi:MAG: 2-polyprenyl-6-methoxyphenol hydroxylase-like oxidoreductase [bacterium]|nr:2-polyprenyl-6-methoxyphenol hydroxylase-like oxidoreductase [bacterium]
MALIQRQHAVVIGASMAGLLAARVLSDHFERVTVIERDTLPDEAAHRAGVPQSRHVHGLLVRGLDILRDLFPGLDADLDAGGVETIEWMTQTIQRMATGWTPIYASGIHTRPITRALLESIVRRRVMALQNVTFRTGWQVTRLCASPDNTRVTGVEIEPRRKSDDAPPVQALPADLVIDASGRGSQAPAWLEALGYRPPKTVTVNGRLGYASRMYRLKDGCDPAWRVLLMITTTAFPRGGVFTVVEKDTWMLTMAGVGDHVPPTDEDGLNAFVKSLGSAPLDEVMAHAEPISPIYGYRRTENRRVDYHKLSRMPHGFAVTGDAVCAFNPVYGQGMTAAAVAATALDASLRAGWDERAFQKRLAAGNQQCWLMAVCEDARYPSTEGVRHRWVYSLLNRWNDWLFAGMPHSPTITQTFLKVMHLLAPPTALMHPRMIRERLRLSRRLRVG